VDLLRVIGEEGYRTETAIGFLSYLVESGERPELRIAAAKRLREWHSLPEGRFLSPRDLMNGFDSRTVGGSERTLDRFILTVWVFDPHADRMKEDYFAGKRFSISELRLLWDFVHKHRERAPKLEAAFLFLAERRLHSSPSDPSDRFLAPDFGGLHLSSRELEAESFLLEKAGWLRIDRVDGAWARGIRHPIPEIRVASVRGMLRRPFEKIREPLREFIAMERELEVLKAAVRTAREALSPQRFGMLLRQLLFSDRLDPDVRGSLLEEAWRGSAEGVDLEVVSIVASERSPEKVRRAAELLLEPERILAFCEALMNPQMKREIARSGGRVAIVAAELPGEASESLQQLSLLIPRLENQGIIDPAERKRVLDRIEARLAISDPPSHEVGKIEELIRKTATVRRKGRPGMPTSPRRFRFDTGKNRK
jgi:hypothetical protein